VIPASLLGRLQAERCRLETAFAPDTAYLGREGATPSTGHCAAVAAIVQLQLGGDLLSTIIDGEPHWYNRVFCDRSRWDVDLTGDQFGRPPIQAVAAGDLYHPSLLRSAADLTPEALVRASRLADRAGLPAIALVLRGS
jgi:hypothetical protein